MVMLRTASGRLCQISNSRRATYGYDQRIEAFGSAGAARADNLTRSAVSTWTEAGAVTDGFENFFLERYADAYRLAMNHFAQVLKGAAPKAGLIEALAALALAEAAEQSARTGAPVRL